MELKQKQEKVNITIYSTLSLSLTMPALISFWLWAPGPAIISMSCIVASLSHLGYWESLINALDMKVLQDKGYVVIPFS